MERVLQSQLYLLGERFTLADASAYGQLSMNLTDAPAARQMEDLAPRTFRWLSDIRDGAHADATGELRLSPALEPLLRCIGDTFVPLMRHNERGYAEAKASGETLFNEDGFDEGRSLYDGEMLGSPFRSVAKSFQVVPGTTFAPDGRHSPTAIEPRFRVGCLRSTRRLRRSTDW